MKVTVVLHIAILNVDFYSFEENILHCPIPMFGQRKQMNGTNKGPNPFDCL